MNRVIIIAEAGVNHNGNLDKARRLIDIARAVGADIVKFQTFHAESLVCKSAKKAEYQKASLGNSGTQYEMLKQLEFSDEDHQQLIDHCRDAGIEYLSTAFDIDSVALLHSLGVRKWKIPSGAITNLPYLREIGSLKEPVLLSTGMSNLGEIERALAVLEAAGSSRSEITILHCTTEYPAPLDEVNLKAMVTLGHAFDVPFGYSDHTKGISIPIAAVAMGATVIEKHFTLDKELPGPDHRASLDPLELSAMVKSIREVETALGDGIKRVTRAEKKNALVIRKAIVARIPIRKGDLFTINNITTKRPAEGLSPMEWDSVIGTVARRDYTEDERI